MTEQTDIVPSEAAPEVDEDTRRVANLGMDLISHAADIDYGVVLLRLKDGRLMLLEHAENNLTLATLLAWGTAMNNSRLLAEATRPAAEPGEIVPE